MGKIAINERNWPFACLELVGIVLALVVSIRLLLGKIGPFEVAVFSAAVIFALVGAALFYRQNKSESEQAARTKDLEHAEKMAQLFNEREKILNDRAGITGGLRPS